MRILYVFGYPQTARAWLKEPSTAGKVWLNGVKAWPEGEIRAFVIRTIEDARLLAGASFDHVIYHGSFDYYACDQVEQVQHYLRTLVRRPGV